MAPRAPWSRLLLLACAATVLAPLAAAMSSPDADEQHTWWQVKEQETGEQLPRAAVEDTQTAAPQQQQQQQQLGRRSVIGTANLAAEHGYTAENHTVRTADGFLLTLFRLVGPAAPASAASARPPVLLAHALLGSSADFLVLGKGRALAPLLHDAGFDVWLFNARGTTSSKKHEHLSPAHAKFWDFSWHEIGVLDLPASIDYVLKATNQSQLHYIGFCQGSTTFLVLGSERPEYMDKVKTFVGLAPVAYLKDIRSFPLRLLSIAPNKLYFIMRLIGLNEFLPSSKLVSFVADVLCTEGDIYQPICTNVLFLLFGTDTEQMNTTVLPDFFANAPAGAASKQLLHFGQLVNHRRLLFRQFDYGRPGNMRKYRNPKPPDYNLSRVAAPSYLFHADNDLLCVQSNIDELGRRLPNIPKDGMRRVASPHFNHLDFILARNAKELVYDDVIDILQRHDQPPTLAPSSTAAPGSGATGAAVSSATTEATPSTTTAAPSSTAASTSTVATTPTTASPTTTMTAPTAIPTAGRQA